MKKLITILLLLLSTIAYSQTKKIAPDVRNSPSDKYSLGYDSLYTGGLKVLKDTVSRNNLLANTPLVFKNGSFVYTVKDSTMWMLDSTKSPVWVDLWTGPHLNRTYTAVEVLNWDGQGSPVFTLSFPVYQLISLQVNSSILNIYSSCSVVGNQLTITDPLLEANYKITITYNYKL